MVFILAKVGSTFDALRVRRGDYDVWFRARTSLDARTLQVVEVHAGQPMPAVADCTGVIVSGSPAMVTDRASWSVGLGDWLRAAVELEVPVLGVCYGHQLLADALGGAVDFNPFGRQIGSVSLALEHEASDDPLLGALPASPVVHVSHRQAVTRLPPGAVTLAKTKRDPHHAFRVGPSAWGVQFHPEFDADIAREYVRERAAAIEAEGDDPAQLLAAVREDDVGEQVLRRFVALSSER